MNKRFFALTFAALFTVNLHASSFFSYTPQGKSVGLYVGGQIWQSETSGTFGDKNALRDFNLKKEQQSNYFVAVEHPFSLLPNARISSTSLNSTGESLSTQAFTFDNETFLADANIDANFNVSYVDYTLYYQLFDDRLFSFDVGLTARDFKGALRVTGRKTIVTTTTDPDLEGEDHEGHDHTVSETTNIVTTGTIKTDNIVPMLYLATNIGLPLKGLSVFTQGDFTVVGEHSVYDYQVGLSYGLVQSQQIDVSLSLGYRAVQIAFENVNGLYTDLKFKGAFVGVIAHF